MVRVKAPRRVLDTRLWVRDAIEQGKGDKLDVLLREGAHVDEVDGLGRTPMFHAIRLNNLEIAKVLLARKCNLNHWDADGMPLLFFACQHGKAEGVKFLIENDVNLKEKDHREKTALHYCAEYGNVPVMRILLETEKFDIDAVDVWGRTPLWYAARTCESDAVDCLLSKGATLMVADSAGHMPLHAAAMGGDREICQCLVISGAPINARSYSGTTALYLAAEMGNPSACEYLLTVEGIDYESKDWFGRMAVSRAIAYRHHSVVRVFAQAEKIGIEIPQDFWREEKLNTQDSYYQGHKRAVFLPKTAVANRRDVLRADPDSMQGLCDKILERQRNMATVLASTLVDQPPWVMEKLEEAEKALRDEVLEILYDEHSEDVKKAMSRKGSIHRTRSNSLPDAEILLQKAKKKDDEGPSKHDDRTVSFGADEPAQDKKYISPTGRRRRESVVHRAIQKKKNKEEAARKALGGMTVDTIEEDDEDLPTSPTVERVSNTKMSDPGLSLSQDKKVNVDESGVPDIVPESTDADGSSFFVTDGAVEESAT